MSNFNTLVNNYDRACEKVENAISCPFNYTPDQMRKLAEKAEDAGAELLKGLPQMSLPEKKFAMNLLTTYQSSIAFLRYLAGQGDKMMEGE